MRTRFLSVDPSTSVTFQALENLEFLRIPPPHVPPLSASTFGGICCFDDVSALNISLEMETLPIDSALSKFFSDVVPGTIDDETGEFSSIGCFPGETGFYKKRNFSPGSIDEVQYPKDKNEPFRNAKEENCFEAVEFEMPELDLSLENTCFFEEEKIELFAEVLEASENLLQDMLGPELMLRGPIEILKSIYSVDDITMEQKDFLFEEAVCAQDQIPLHNSRFPVLEVDEIVLGISGGPHMEQGFLPLENIEPQVCPQKDVIVYSQELLGSLKIDILDFLADHSLSKQCFEDMPSCLTLPLAMDVLSIIELPLLEGNSVFRQGIPDDNSFWSASHVNFEEIQFLEFDSCQSIEVFCNSVTVYEAEPCEQMFVEDSNSWNFNELIVSHELTLVDESFKSLPVPILFDPEKITSQFLFAEQMLAGLKPQYHSTSDRIYLDWHFLEEDNSNCDKYSCWKQVFETTNYHVDYYMEPINDGNIILDFVFSGETQNGASVEEKKEILNILCRDIPTVTVPINDFASCKLLSEGCGKHGYGEVSSGINAGRGSTVVEALLPFNELNSFLKPQDATEGRNSKPAVKSFDRNPLVTEVSRINQIAPRAAMAVQHQQRDLKLHPVKLAGLAGKVRELVNDFHEENCDMESSRVVNDAKAFCMPLPVPRLASAVEPERIPIDMSSFPDTIIIVNTQNFDEEMIISRRSTYQKILALEKKGVQIVERDLKFPVDIIISAASCLAVYDCRNIGKKASAPDEASSCLPLCIENIAASVLTSLSFAFSSCILVFEGDSEFLAGVMESSDELYAAAASLRIDLQLFCSYSSELTDEIILSCIGRAPKLNGHNYPKMPESETLAESFLTMFPSINPLSAHAILSSVCTLAEFLELSHEHRILALQNYHVPDESLSLFSTLCKYGEREDSRSAITDCSSSVSSAPDSENCHGKTNSVRKKPKYIERPPETLTPVDYLSDLELLKQLPDTWMSGIEEIFDEIEKPGAFVTDKAFGEKQVSGTDISNDIKKLGWHLDDNLFGTEDGFDRDPMNKRDFRLANNSKNRRDDLIGEVIDIHDSFSLGEDFSDIANALDLSCLVPETDRAPAVGNFTTASRLSFNRSSHPTFPSAAEISSDSSILVNNYAKSLREEYSTHTDADFSKNKLDSKHQEKLLEDGSIQRTATKFPSLSVEKNNTLQRSGRQLSKAAQSAQRHYGSPWTIEFLNRTNEKSRSRQQSVPRGMSPLCLAYSGNISKVTKRKSPSILDFYRYQGGSSTPRKIIEQKRQKLPSQPSSSSKNETTSASSGPSWTPLDKRARQTLSFSMGGGGGQSKLVWNDKNAQIMDRRFYH